MTAQATAARNDQENGRSAREPRHWLALALLCALFAALPLVAGPGLVNTRAGGDSPFLLQRAQQLAEAIRGGHLPARWMPDAAHGLGYPFFNYYAALPYYPAAVLHLLGCDLVRSVQAVQVFGFLLAGAAMYLLARRCDLGPPAACAASAAYTFVPFRLANIYVRGDALAEFYASALVPLVLWAALRLIARPSPGRIALLAAAFAALVLSHNITALLAAPLAVLWLLAGVLERPRCQRQRALLAGGGALALGLALSAWFWLPALREQPYVQLVEQTTGYLHYRGHFLGASEVIQPALRHDYAIAWDRHPFHMGLVQALLAGLGLAALAVRAAARRRLGALSASILLLLAASTWLLMPSSDPVWARLPYLEYVQFPWRLLSLQAVATALLSAQPAALLAERWGGLRRAAGPSAAAIAAVSLLSGMAGIAPDRLQLTNADLTTERWQLYETFSGNIGSTIRYEYLPQQMVPRPRTGPAQMGRETPLVLEGVLLDAQRLARGPTHETWRLRVAEEALLAFPRSAFPGWRAWVDDGEQPVALLPGLGLLGLRLPPGEHTVRLALRATRARRYAEWVSALGLLVWLMLAAFAWRRSPATRRRLLRGLGFCAALGLFTVGAARATALPTTLDGPLVMDFTRAPLLHHEAGGIHWGEARLLDYARAVTPPSAGASLRYDVQWSAPRPDYRVHLDMVALTAHLHEPAPVWAETWATLTDARMTLTLDLPETLPPGLYVPRLNVHQGGRTLTPENAAGVTMGTIHLQPVHITAQRLDGEGAEPIAHFGPEGEPSAVALLAARARPPADGIVEVVLEWRSERQAPLNYYLSLRVIDAEGERLVARDLPPLLGIYPTSLWRPGERLRERVLLPYEVDGVPAGARLEVVLYDRATLRAVGTAVIEDPWSDLDAH